MFDIYPDEVVNYLEGSWPCCIPGVETSTCLTADEHGRFRQGGQKVVEGLKQSGEPTKIPSEIGRHATCKNWFQM
jgi:hypothetical protein